ncbi:aminoglycoside phosphotransferase [Novosphingobium marinum]|uniref:Aminoglycoside phosphotransferase (APT) family kinase protein n=2 Tax=Novosphingobium marinum TaxID=1514948 RepID=A0A7Y9XYA1_9SPHN|nr:aminoglycoside phosphotransferase (APT) family kinase protein [Novosphingobium marinum]GGC27528.1 aminoglycoside phosphotransferase [Novosphingobium marinum]
MDLPSCIKMTAEPLSPSPSALMPPAAVIDGLQAWAARFCGPLARVESVRDLGGHSGETFCFTVIEGDRHRDLVVRLAPPEQGDRAADNLMRQASLLRLLSNARAKVPSVVDASATGQDFAGAHMIVEMLAGRPLIMGPEGGKPWLPPEDRRSAYCAAASELARFHERSVLDRLDGWDTQRTPAEEVALWQPALDRSAQADWTGIGMELADALAKSAPAEWTPGLCHGDFQTNNILFDRNDSGVVVTGVVDWEVAHIGATELDIAWFIMMNDPLAWDPVERRGEGLDLASLVASYEEAAQRAVGNLDWFHALACYRIALIAGYKIKLHRTGRKRDEAWERASSSVPRLFSRAADLLSS